MAILSENAFDLLSTIRKRGRKFGGTGTFFTDSEVAYWYHDDSDEDLLDENDRAAIAELIEIGLAKSWQDNNDEYTLTPRGENYVQTQPNTTSHITQNFSGINNSNIANMSPGAHQSLDISSYELEVQEAVAELQDAVVSKDDTRAKRIIDGLWVSAPQLALSLIQIGLSASGIKQS